MKRVMIGTIVCMAAVAMVVIFWPRSNARVEGLSLSDWIFRHYTELLDGHVADPRPLQNATKQVVPELVEWISFNEKSPREILLRHGANQTVWDNAVVKKLSKGIDKHVIQAEMAVHVFSALGTNAAGAIPALKDFALADGWDRRGRAIRALAAIGPPAAPALAEVMPNMPAGKEVLLYRDLEKLGTNAAPLVPVLLRQFQSENQYTATTAAALLSRLKLNDARVLATLQTAAQSGPYRLTAIAALGEYAAHDSNALPPLVAALRDKDKSVRIAAAFALRPIAPDTLTNYTDN